MNYTSKIEKGPVTATPPTDPSSGVTVPDSDSQAILDLGQLAALARTYEDLLAQYNRNPSPALKALLDKTLKEFQTLYGYFSVNGNTVTFNYNEGQEIVTITDPGALSILKNMPVLSNPPTAADVKNYLTNYWDDSTNSPVLKIMQWLVDTGFNASNDTDNSITETSLVFFYISLVNNPIAELAGIPGDFFSEGSNNGWVSNIFSIAAVLSAHLQNDTTLLDPDVVAACLSINTQDSSFQQLGQFFASVYKDPNWLKGLPSEKDLWAWESSFFSHPAQSNTGTVKINAIPDKENSELDNQAELEKKLKSKKTEGE